MGGWDGRGKGLVGAGGWCVWTNALLLALLASCCGSKLRFDDFDERCASPSSKRRRRGLPAWSPVLARLVVVVVMVEEEAQASKYVVCADTISRDYSIDLPPLSLPPSLRPLACASCTPAACPLTQPLSAQPRHRSPSPLKYTQPQHHHTGASHGTPHKETALLRPSPPSLPLPPPPPPCPPPPPPPRSRYCHCCYFSC